MATTQATWRGPDALPRSVLVKLWLIRAASAALVVPFLVVFAQMSRYFGMSLLELLVATVALAASSILARGSNRLPVSVLKGQVKQPRKGQIAKSFPVWIEWRRGTVVAADDGLLSFRDGMLCFDGRRTGFRIGRGRVPHALWWQTTDLNSPSALVYAGETELRIFPALTWRLKKRLREDLRSQLGHWAPDDSVRDEVLPPATPDPAYATAQGRLAWWYFGIGLILPCAGFLLYWLRVSVDVFPFFLGGITLLCLAAPAGARAGNANKLLNPASPKNLSDAKP